jgi:tetratricopeptide (TPR) repeat protein
MTNARRLVLVCALLLAAGTISSSQTRPPAETPVDAAVRALNAGRFDQIDSLLKGSTDPRAVVLRAQAEIQRGRYPQAEALLTPAVGSNPGGDAAVELGLLQLYLGRRADGKRTLQRVIEVSPHATTADFLRLGRASRALGEFQDANAHFRQASALAADDVATNIEWGELFLEKYNRGDALKSFQAAVRADPDNVRARLDLARVVLHEDPPAAAKEVEKVLATNPSYVPAHLLTAEFALDDRRRDDARAAIKKALEVNPNSLEAHALEGAIAVLEGRTADFNARVAEVLKVNPGYGEVYRLAGSHLARNYRFEEAVEMTRRALMIDPDSTRAYSDLGLQLMRTGDEPGARRALETSFKADPYDVVTFNLLSLLDTLDKFQTITDGNIVMRFHADEAAVMREYALPLAKQALDTYQKSYGFTPAGPILIEMFPKHDDFAVRTLGLPGMIGALGACFGKVVTLDSPRAREPGQFSWEATLWHELAHVMTLQMSNNRVPRWLTEGISEWEEKRARPEWGREMEVSFAQAMEANKVLKVKDLNDGFTNPELISLAYFEASLLVEHLVATYGEPALHTLLRAYGKGLETDAALQEAFKTSVAEIQTSFDAKIEKDFGAMRRALKRPEIPEDAGVEGLRAAAQANPESFAVHMRLAMALRKAGDPDGAIRELERAAQLLPGYTGNDSPNELIAAIALEQKNTTRAVQALEAVVRVDGNDVESARKLASLLSPQADPMRAAAAYRRVVELDPFDSGAQSSFGRLALQRKDVPVALRAFRAALASSPADEAAAQLDLAEGYLAGGDRAEAKKHALAALEIAPSFERAQDVLLKIVDAGAGGER